MLFVTSTVVITLRKERTVSTLIQGYIRRFKKPTCAA